MVRVKKSVKKETPKATVPDIDRIHRFDFSPIPDVPNIDFDVRKFLSPIGNIPYSTGYPQ